MNNPSKQSLSKEQALQKCRHYCIYQERCHQEVKEKLYSFGLFTKEVDELIASLIEENYLNEERFAVSYAGGKFRMKQWGKVKIKHALKQKQVSAYCIKNAINQIGEDRYSETLFQLAGSKWKMLKGEKNVFIRKRKTYDYLLQKGYESDLINEALNSLPGKL